MHDDLGALLVGQCGVVSRRQLTHLGYRPHDIKRLIRQRRLARVHPGVYVGHTGPPTWEQQAWAAVLAVWPAVLCAESAIHDPAAAPGQAAPIHVAVDGGRRCVAPAGVTVHRITGLHGRAQWNRSPPRLRPEDAALDVAADAESEFAAFGVLAEVCRMRRTTPERLAAALAQRGRMRHRAWLAAVLADLTAGTTSVLEQRYARDIERAHRLPASRRQVRAAASTGVVYRDVEYADGLIVELDGRLVHNTVVQRDADFERDLDAALGGRVTVRLSWGQVVGRPCSTAAKIAQLLQHRGWAGEARPCGPSCPLRPPAA